jgi:serine/threonine protein kinase
MSTHDSVTAEPAIFKEINQRYRIESIFRDGEHFRVLHAFADDQPVAIYIPKDQQVSKNWARLLRGLQHQGLPKHIEDFETVNGTVVVTEWIVGTPLAKLLSEGRYRHTEQFSVQLLLNAAHILTYLHGLRPPIIHGDLSAENLILSESDDIVLIDFSRASDDPRESHRMALDVYSLAETGLRMLTGLNVEDAPKKNQRLDLEALQLSRPLATILADCLHENPIKRPTAADLSSRLTTLLAPIETSSESISFTQRPLSSAPKNISALPVDAIQEVVSSAPQISIDTITIPEVAPPKPSGRENRLNQLWDEVQEQPGNTEVHEKFAEFAVESAQYQAAAELYREFERSQPLHREMGEKYRHEIAIKAGARIIASQPKATVGPQSVAGFSKWSLIGSSAGLMIAALIQSWPLALLSGPVFAFGLWARFRSRSSA